MLEQVIQDQDKVPEVAEGLAPWRDYMRDVAGGLSGGWARVPKDSAWSGQQGATHSPSAPGARSTRAGPEAGGFTSW